MCDLIFYLKNYLENNSWNFLFARAWKCNSISFVVIVIVAFCAQFILYIPSLLTESYCTLRTFDRMLFYRNASAILCRNGCLQNSYASFHITPCIRSFLVFTLFRSKSMTRVWIAVVSIRRPIVLFENPSHLSIPTESHLFPNTSRVVPFAKRTEDLRACESAPWSRNKSGASIYRTRSDVPTIGEWYNDVALTRKCWSYARLNVSTSTWFLSSINDGIAKSPLKNLLALARRAKGKQTIYCHHSIPHSVIILYLTGRSIDQRQLFAKECGDIVSSYQDLRISTSCLSSTTILESRISC